MTPPDVTQMIRDEDAVIELGDGHTLAAVFDQNDRLVGWLHTHPDARGGGRSCQSFCAVRSGLGPEVHHVTHVMPLSLAPSLKCRACGAHGEVLNGKWESR